MNQLDVYYRALSEWRALTTQNRECNSFCSAVAGADTANDKMQITRMVCTIEEDWISEIEKGLEYIEKAIKEERQFIYSNGEVMPIEKVKHVSTESVRHLAKHSNLIGKIEEGEDFVPDKLYTVERLNDYAVYENRFLYMLLCYLRDFVTLRYNKILDLTNKYDGVLKINKEVTFAKQKITYSVDLHDERPDDKYLREHNSAKKVIDRIDIILKTVISFLGTPLMESAAKTPMLKPPITKTNVLKMDNNFKGAVALYDYIISYTKPGFIAEEEKIDLAPFREDLADELSEACAMLAFLMYENGLGMKPYLKERFEEEERRRELAAIEKRAEKLEAIRRKIKNSGESPEEYVLEIEKQLKSLENENARIDILIKELEALKSDNESLGVQIESLREEITLATRETDELEEKHALEMETLKEEMNKRIHDNITKHEEETRALEKQCNDMLETANSEMREMREQCRVDVATAREERREMEYKYESLFTEHERLTEAKTLCEARLKAMRAQQGLMTDEDDFTERESFGVLEKEFKAFERFYNSQWSKTKKKIRKSILNKDNLISRKRHK
jgi:hypothetical protein